ncbi:hypothetical protein BDC45DRAFT_191652 [Circinella umbellata]|nr:hypothetical protein BDC45DRAFT_191652 [Circinella umbellata]
MAPSDKSTHEKKKNIIDFLTGDGEEKISFNFDTDKWQVNDTEVTEELLNYGTSSIQKAKNGKKITIHEELSLNCVFIIDNLNSVTSSRLEYGFDDLTWKKMVQEYHDRYPMHELPDHINLVINQYAKAARKNFADVDHIVRGVPLGEDGGVLAESMFNLASTYAPNTSTKAIKPENSFTTEVINPVILPFFKETSLTTRKGIDAQAAGSSRRRKKVGRFTDLSVFFEYGDLPSPGLVLVEIKPPSKVSNGQRPHYVKLSNEMKGAISRIDRRI